MTEPKNWNTSKHKYAGISNITVIKMNNTCGFLIHRKILTDINKDRTIKEGAKTMQVYTTYCMTTLLASWTNIALISLKGGDNQMTMGQRG